MAVLGLPITTVGGKCQRLTRHTFVGLPKKCALGRRGHFLYIGRQLGEVAEGLACSVGGYCAKLRLLAALLAHH